MITNAYCTVVRTDDNGEYKIVGTYPCMWQEVEAYEVKKYGEDNAGKAAVWVPDISADVQKHDYIFRGVIADILEFSPDNALTVMSVSRNDYGSLIRTETCGTADVCDYCICGDKNPIAQKYELVKNENGLLLSREKNF